MAKQASQPVDICFIIGKQFSYFCIPFRFVLSDTKQKIEMENNEIRASESFGVRRSAFSVHTQSIVWHLAATSLAPASTHNALMLWNNIIFAIDAMTLTYIGNRHHHHHHFWWRRRLRMKANFQLILIKINQDARRSFVNFSFDIETSLVRSLLCRSSHCRRNHWIGQIVFPSRNYITSKQRLAWVDDNFCCGRWSILHGNLCVTCWWRWHRVTVHVIVMRVTKWIWLDFIGEQYGSVRSSSIYLIAGAGPLENWVSVTF